MKTCGRSDRTVQMTLGMIYRTLGCLTIALQLVRGKQNVHILITSRGGQLERVSRKLTTISGELSLRDAEIEFVRANHS
jgi:hypothetical protein